MCSIHSGGGHCPIAGGRTHSSSDLRLDSFQSPCSSSRRRGLDRILTKISRDNATRRLDRGLRGWTRQFFSLSARALTSEYGRRPLRCVHHRRVEPMSSNPILLTATLAAEPSEE